VCEVKHTHKKKKLNTEMTLNFFRVYFRLISVYIPLANKSANAKTVSACFMTWGKDWR